MIQTAVRDSAGSDLVQLGEALVSRAKRFCPFRERGAAFGAENDHLSFPPTRVPQMTRGLTASICATELHANAYKGSFLGAAPCVFLCWDALEIHSVAPSSVPQNNVLFRAHLADFWTNDLNPTTACEKRIGGLRALAPNYANLSAQTAATQWLCPKWTFVFVVRPLQ